MYIIATTTKRIAQLWKFHFTVTQDSPLFQFKSSRLQLSITPFKIEKLRVIGEEVYVTTDSINLPAMQPFKVTDNNQTIPLFKY